MQPAAPSFNVPKRSLQGRLKIIKHASEAKPKTRLGTFQNNFL